MRKNAGPTKYPREEILDPRNTHEIKKIRPTEYPREKILAHEVPKRKNFGHTKARWYKTHRV